MAQNTPNILIVESDPRQTELTTDLVRDIVRANIDTTNSGERALELISRTPYQLVVADCSMADLDGISLLERIKRISPSSSVILYSSSASIEEAVRATRFGADEYLHKPFDPEQFKLSARRCLDRRDLFSVDQSVTRLMHLLNACQLISAATEEERIFETAMSYLKVETGAKAIALFRRIGNGAERVPTSVDHDADVVEVYMQGSKFLQALDSPNLSMKHIPKSSSKAEVAAFPLRCVSEDPLMIVCIAPVWKADPEEVDSRFRLLQAQIQMTGRTIRSYQGVKHLVYLDEPTGIFNSRYLHQALDQWTEKVKTDPKFTFSLLFLDLDRFKSVNDQYGHLVGTKLLWEVAQVLQENLRIGTDLAFRYGGDEFVVALPRLKTPQALEVAERIRAAIESRRFLARENLNVKLTASIGVANLPEHGLTKRAVIDAADNAMYIVKKSLHRNNVSVAAALKQKKSAA